MNWNHIHTRGPVYRTNVCRIVTASGAHVASTANINNSRTLRNTAQIVADAELIAEAFNVATETGMTPRQLVNRVKSYDADTPVLCDMIKKLEAQRDELLAELQRVEKLARNVPVFQEFLPSIRAAITKATGEAALAKATEGGK